MKLSNKLLYFQILLIITLLIEWSTAFKQNGVCFFPERWQGTWFQSGVRQSIIIDGSRLSSKGRCIGSDGDKYVVVDEKGVCFRCVVIHEKHPNVLQYKETYCHGKDSLPTLCGLITGDALLYSMFREDALPVNCPFHGPFTFTYNRGHGECRNPVSSIDICTEESRLLLSYQACPDVYGTESTVEELQCLATWKEGSSRYLVGKVHHNHATSNEDRFRCFVYEKTTQNQVISSDANHTPTNGGTGTSLSTSVVDYRVAQSGDATCNGLFSATEGSRTMTLRKATSPNKCRFPSWLAVHQHWHSLDNTAEYNFHHRNATLHISSPTGLDMKVICSQIKQVNKEDSTSVALILAHFTMGCQSGYMCMMYYRRDNHVVEVQTGQHVKRQEDACLPAFFNRSTLPYVTLVTQNVESRQCPYTGKFSVSGLLRSNQDTRNIRALWQPQQQQQQQPPQTTHDLQQKRVKRVMDPQNSATCDSNKFDTLVIGCRNTDTLEFHSDCPVTDFFSTYSCHGRWEENGTNYLIMTPQSRSSHGAKRYCFIYRELQALIQFSISSDNCNRNIRPGIDGELAFNVTVNGKCVELNDGQQPHLDLWTLLSTLLPVFINYLLFQIER